MMTRGLERKKAHKKRDEVEEEKGRGLRALSPDANDMPRSVMESRLRSEMSGIHGAAGALSGERTE